MTSKGKGEGKDLETYDERPTMRDQETQTSDGVLCMSHDEFILMIEEWQTKLTKRLVEESAALELVSGPLQAVEDLERRAQEGHTVREETIRRLRDALELI